MLRGMSDKPFRSKIAEIAARLRAAETLDAARELSGELERLAREPKHAPRGPAKPRTGLSALLVVDPQDARQRVVQAYQGGRTTEQAAAILGVSKRTLERAIAADPSLALAVSTTRAKA